MSGGTLVHGIGEARNCLSRASEVWDAADLERMEASRQLLHSATAELRQVMSAINGGTAEATEELRAAALALKQEIGQMFKVVDACSAFHRGLSVRLGGITTTYTASGRVSGETSSVEIPLHG